MQIVKVGVNYQVAPVEIREKLRFSDETVEQAMLSLQAYEHVSENIILSTCNRTELFAVVDDLEPGKEDLIRFLCTWFHISRAELMKYCQFKYEDDAIQHAFRLAVGLDSLVLGETQILGQVRQAFVTAQQLRTAGRMFNELFKRVLTFAKSAHNDTIIGEQAVSISYVAVELSKKMFGQMKGKHAVILGAGEMGELSLKNLHGSGVSEITVVNRNLDRAKQIAQRFRANAVSLEQLDEVLVTADILISSTGSNTPVLTKERVEKIQQKRKNKSLFLIDIAVPRDIEADVDSLDNIFLYDVDDLQYVADANMEARKEAAALIESQLVHELSSFRNWVYTLDVVPIIRALREKSFDIQARTLESIFRKIPDLDEREIKVLRKHTKSIVNQLIEHPIKQAKLISTMDASEEKKEMFIEIFGLDKNLYDNM